MKKAHEYTVEIKVLATGDDISNEELIDAIKKFFKFHNGITTDIVINDVSLMFDDKNIKIKK